jgi:hypothetical protein
MREMKTELKNTMVDSHLKHWGNTNEMVTKESPMQNPKPMLIDNG